MLARVCCCCSTTPSRRAPFFPQKGYLLHPRRASPSRPGLDALIPAVRGSVRYSKPPAHRDALSQPSGSRRATPSRRLTRHVSTSTGAPNTSHTRTQNLANNRARVCDGLFYRYSKHEGSGPPPDMGVEPQAALSSILANSTLLHLVTLTLELLRDQLPEVLLPIFFF